MKRERLESVVQENKYRHVDNTLTDILARTSDQQSAIRSVQRRILDLEKESLWMPVAKPLAAGVVGGFAGAFIALALL